MSGPSPRLPLCLLLGPTNTGKTHRAVERMMEHETGMLGLPLRLLAREIYDRITADHGEREVALVTGEEKRIPLRPRYWVCTVEAMPLDLEVDFLAVDEVQLMAHPRRGHVFTDRVLRARGRLETWFLGSHSARPLLEQLLPSGTHSSRPRLSTLRHVGAMGLSQLPPHSAVVAFNTPQVYQLAERLRQKRGGAAVVLGALSPRARNAQVALFQSGEVQYLVATDAIGMGLNLSVEHIALAALHKFDGKEGRALSLGELAQIAGRAGRYLVDGTFGTLAPCPALPLGVARAIESHQLPFERSAVFRNSDLDYASIPSLLASLTAQPRRPMLKRLGLAEADDTLALTRLGTRSEVVTWAQGRERVELLWQVCQIPDYGKLLPEAHAELVFQVYEQLITRGCLSEDWFAERLGRLDTTEGDLETLLSRIAFVRTWTYLSHQSSWVINAEHWQNQSRDLEDRLSDALHERLVQRFVERTARRVDLGQRSSRRRPSLRDEECAEFDPQSPFAALARLRLQPALAPKSVDLDAWIDASDEAFELTSTGRIESQGRLLGKLRRGSALLHPEVRIELASQPGEQLRLERRLRALVRDRVASLLEPLREQDSDSAPMRGVLYQLRQALGCLPRKQVQEQLRQLRGAERADLRARGIEWDARFVLSRPLFTAPALRTRAALSSVHYQLPEAVLPRDAAEQYPRPSNVPSQALLALGYVALGDTCVRCDRLDPSTHGDGGPVPATQKAKRSNRRRRRTRKSRLELQ